MKFRKLLSLVMVVAMVLSLLAMAGCGNDDDYYGDSGSDTEDEFFADMPEELRGTKVQFATWIDHEATETSNTLRGFERETGMDIEITAVPQASYLQKISSLIAADEAPDVIVENSGFPTTLSVLAPLSWEENCIDPKDPFWDQGITELSTVGNETYLVIAANSTWNMVGAYVLYNKTSLVENGIKTPLELYEENNWNLDTFISTLRQMKQRYLQNEEPAIVAVGHVLDMFGAAQIKRNKETGLLENGLRSPEALAALQWCVKYKDEGLFDLSNDQGNAMRYGGMLLGGAYSLRSKPGWFYDDDWRDYEAVVLPKINATDEEYPKTCTSRAYGICKAAKNPKGGGYFLRYFLNGDNYDLNEVFKNEMCKNMFLDLRDKYMDYNDLEIAYGIYSVVSPDVGTAAGGVLRSIKKASYAQLGTELSKGQNVVDAAVAKGNEYFAQIIAQQQ